MVEIRELHETDFDELAQLFESVADERRWIGTEPGFDRERYRASWRKQLNGGGDAAFVALEDGALIGYIGTHPHEDYGTVFGMLIARTHRGRGIGANLLQRLIDWAKERNVPQISLLVFPHNTAAIALYRKFGFVDHEYNKNDVRRQTGEVWDSIAMTKQLSH